MPFKNSLTSMARQQSFRNASRFSGIRAMQRIDKYATLRRRLRRPNWSATTTKAGRAFYRPASSRYMPILSPCDRPTRVDHTSYGIHDGGGKASRNIITSVPTQSAEKITRNRFIHESPNHPAANPAGASWLQSLRPVCRVAGLLGRLPLRGFIMKIKTACISVLVLTGLLWACWSFAYHRGYSRGARDEFACWKQVPTRLDDNWDGTLVGHRDAWTLPGGKKDSASVVRVRDHSINNIPSRVLP